MRKFSYFIYKLIKFDFQIISREFDEKFESLHYAVPSADLHSLISQVSLVWLLQDVHVYAYQWMIRKLKKKLLIWTQLLYHNHTEWSLGRNRKCSIDL